MVIRLRAEHVRVRRALLLDLRQLRLKLSVHGGEPRGGVVTAAAAAAAAAQRRGRRRRQRERRRVGVGDGAGVARAAARVERLVHVPLAHNRLHHGLRLLLPALQVVQRLARLALDLVNLRLVLLLEPRALLLLVQGQRADHRELALVLVLQLLDALEVHQLGGHHRGGVHGGARDARGNARPRPGLFQLGHFVQQELHLPRQVRRLRLERARLAVLVPRVRDVALCLSLHAAQLDGGLLETRAHLGVRGNRALVLLPLLRQHRRALLQLGDHAVHRALQPLALEALGAPGVGGFRVLRVQLSHAQVLPAQRRRRRVRQLHRQQRAARAPGSGGGARLFVRVERRRRERVFVPGADARGGGDAPVEVELRLGERLLRRQPFLSLRRELARVLLLELAQVVAERLQNPLELLRLAAAALCLRLVQLSQPLGRDELFVEVRFGRRRRLARRLELFSALQRRRLGGDLRLLRGGQVALRGGSLALRLLQGLRAGERLSARRLARAQQLL